jgi:hypothetical protein
MTHSTSDIAVRPMIESSKLIVPFEMHLSNVECLITGGRKYVSDSIAFVV